MAKILRVFSPLSWFSRLFVFSSSALVISIAINLRTYSALTAEIPIATLYFKQKKEQQYLVKIHYPNQKRPEQFELEGDEWQMDARMVKWKPLEVIFGSQTIFRLERISGRFYDIKRERETKTIYPLTPDNGLKVWDTLQQVPKDLSGVDAVYGSAVYLPMTDQGAYTILMGLTGLIARPLNAEATQAIKDW